MFRHYRTFRRISPLFSFVVNCFSVRSCITSVFEINEKINYTKKECIKSFAHHHLRSDIDAIRPFVLSLLQSMRRHCIWLNLNKISREVFSEKRSFTIVILTLNNPSMPNSSGHILTTGIRLFKICETDRNNSIGISLENQ